MLYIYTYVWTSQLPDLKAGHKSFNCTDKEKPITLGVSVNPEAPGPSALS